MTPADLLVAAGWVPADDTLAGDPARWRDPQRPHEAALPTDAAVRRCVGDLLRARGYDLAASLRGVRLWTRPLVATHQLTDAAALCDAAGWRLDASRDPGRAPHWYAPRSRVAVAEAQAWVVAGCELARRVAVEAAAERSGTHATGAPTLRVLAGGRGRQTPAGGDDGRGAA